MFDEWWLYVDKVLENIKEISIEQFDDTKILIDTGDAVKCYY